LTAVVLPHDLLKPSVDGFHIAFHERRAQYSRNREVLGYKASVEDLGTADDQIMMDGVLGRKSVVVGFGDAGHAVEIFSVTAPIGREHGGSY